MLGWFKAKGELKRTGHQLYERIVAQARTPALYVACGVPDTMDGRLELILLHLAIVLDRLKPEGAIGQQVGQRLLEAAVADVDDALRQIGIGDDGVAPRIQKLAGAIQERCRDYADGLPSETDGPALEAAIAKHVLGLPLDGPQIPVDPRAARLADYVRASRARLATLGRDQVFAGALTFAPVSPDARQDLPR
jgi:cytochrome b pre-mRNA-processing protein 3